MTDRLERTAEFTFAAGYYIPANKNATAVGSIMSRMKFYPHHMTEVRMLGYTPRLTTGEEIGRVDVRA